MEQLVLMQDSSTIGTSKDFSFNVTSEIPLPKFWAFIFKIPFTQRIFSRILKKFEKQKLYSWEVNSNNLVIVDDIDLMDLMNDKPIDVFMMKDLSSNSYYQGKGFISDFKVFPSKKLEMNRGKIEILGSGDITLKTNSKYENNEKMVKK